MSLSRLRERLDRHGLHLRRDLGQNFLVDEQQANRLAEIAGVGPGDAVIEVGTGLACLTGALAKRAAHVLSIEVDAGLVRALREDGLLPANVELRHADILELELGALIAELGARADGGDVRLVANLPYSVATPLLRRLLDHRHALADWSVMLQKEVAARLFAEVGTRDYGSLAVLHLLCCERVDRAQFSARCFFPVPNVDSTFVRIRARADSPLAEGELVRVERVVRACFGNRRKTIANALRGGGFDKQVALEALSRVGIAERDRAETIAPERLLALSRALLPEEKRGAD